MSLLDRFRPAGALKTYNGDILPFDDTPAARVPAAAKSSLVQWEGELSNFDAWRVYYDGATPELQRNAWGLAQAYAACEWVMRCVNVRAGKVADLLNKCDLIDPRGKVVANGGEWRDALEESYTLYDVDVWKAWARAGLLWGEAFVEKVYRYPNPQRRDIRLPGTFRVLNNLAVSPQVYAGRIHWYQYNDGHQTLQLPAADVIMTKLFNPFDDLRGMSMFVAAMESINTDQYIVAYTKSLFKNNTQFGATFTFKEGYSPTETDWARIKSQINEARGPNNAFRNAFIPAPVDVTQPELPNVDPYDVLQDWQKRRICSTAGVPVALVDFGDARFQLGDEQRKGFYEESVIPDTNDLVRVANVKALPYLGLDGYRLEPNLTSIKSLLEDEEKGASIAREDFQAGTMTLNEYRAKREQAKLPNGDVLLIPAGMVAVPISNLAQLQQMTQPAPIPQPTAQPQLQAPESQPDMVTLPNEAVRTKQQTPEDELKAWARFTVKNGATKSANRFQVYQIPEHIEAWVRSELLNDDNPRGVFDDALMVVKAVAVKAWEETKAGYALELTQYLAEGVHSEINRRNFAARARSADRRYGLIALRDGMNAVGYNPESLSANELAAFREWQAEQSGYVTNLGAEIFGQGISETEIPIRVRMWTDKSLGAIYYRGVSFGAGNKQFRWEIGSTTEHCSTCRENHGQVRAFRDWEQIGLPQSDSLECKGFKCQCRLILME